MCMCVCVCVCIGEGAWWTMPQAHMCMSMIVWLHMHVHTRACAIASLRAAEPGHTTRTSHSQPSAVRPRACLPLAHSQPLQCHVTAFPQVETIGDCYMVAGGLMRRGPDGVGALLEHGEQDPDHARKVVRFAKVRRWAGCGWG